uniref:Secreted protein n=1 Tax=Anguilla anguilla TaxID=7936 RepID=A0A0E9VYL1_ANGAN
MLAVLSVVWKLLLVEVRNSFSEVLAELFGFSPTGQEGSGSKGRPLNIATCGNIFSLGVCKRFTSTVSATVPIFHKSTSTTV